MNYLETINLIGYHKYEFNRDKGDNLSIESEVNFKITKLGVDSIQIFCKK